MNCRMLGRIASIAALSLATANAQVCEEELLYDGTHASGQMESSTRTFPEAPEWVANWGDFGDMKAPYIRLSGMNNVNGDWNGAFVFSKLPRSVQGGTLRLKVRATQNVRFGVWLSGPKGTGSVLFKDLAANTTNNLALPVEQLLGNGVQQVEKVWVGLFNVPAYQYTTLFIDDVALTCAVAVGDTSATAVSMVQDEYVPTKTVPSSPVRNPYCLTTSVALASATYSAADRNDLASKTSAKFVLDVREHEQIQESFSQNGLTPEESRKLWYRNMFFVDRNRLKDSVIANPKAVFEEAVAFASANNFAFMPLLVADVDYAYRVCPDSVCSAPSYSTVRLLQAGLPSSRVNGSKLRLVYDPYFTVSQRSSLPAAEICIAGKCQNLNAGGMVDLEFESAGVQEIAVTLRAGGMAQKQNLYVEVK